MPPVASTITRTPRWISRPQLLRTTTVKSPASPLIDTTRVYVLTVSPRAATNARK